MKNKNLFILIVSFSIVSCYSGKLYSYNVEMTKPVNSKTLEYENDTFHIVFSLEQESIAFKLYNKSESGIKFNWDDVSFSVNGKTYRVVHKETGTFKINDVQPPTTVPPKSNLEDFLIPTDNIHYSPSGNSNKVYLTSTKIFPVNDFGNKKMKQKILDLKGSRITIYMPFIYNGQFVSKYYDLFITDITAKK